MSNVTPIKAPASKAPVPPTAKRLTPDEVQTLVRRAKAVVHGVRVCIDYDEEPSAYALEIAKELLDAVDDALYSMVPKRPSREKEGAQS